MASSPEQDPDTMDNQPEMEMERPGQSTPAHGPEDSPGTDGGTAGTGDGSGQSLVQDEQYER